MIYFKAILAAVGAAFVLSFYTLCVMSSKTKVTGRGAIAAYFYGSPLFWITLVVVCFYAFRITTYR